MADRAHLKPPIISIIPYQKEMLSILKPLKTETLFINQHFMEERYRHLNLFSLKQIETLFQKKT